MSEPVHASASSPPRASSGAASIASGFSQATRLLKLSTPLGQDVLLTECVRGEEGLGLGYVFHIAALSLDAANAANAANAGSAGSHTLAIADHNGSFQPNAQASIADSRPGAVMPQDTMDRWPMQLRREFGVFISHLDDFGQAGADTDAGQRRLHGIGGALILSWVSVTTRRACVISACSRAISALRRISRSPTIIAYPIKKASN